MASGCHFPTSEINALPEAEKLAQIKQAVSRANSALAAFERVRKFILHEEEFTIENNQLTPTLKVRRHIVFSLYQAKLDALYR